MAQMKVLVTGGAGFLAAHLVRALIADGRSVVVADKQPHKIASPLQTLGDSDAVDYVQADLSQRSVAARLGEFGTVFHLAGQPIGWLSQLAGHSTMMSNVGTTEAMLELVRQRQAEQLIFVSSACAFGAPGAEDCPLFETSPMQHGNHPYAESKQQAEALVQQCAVKRSIARFVNLFGAGDWHKSRLVPRIAKQLNFGQPLSLLRSNGRSVLDFMHVSDAVSALLALETFTTEMSKPSKPAPVFHFGYGSPVSVLDLVQEMSRLFDGKQRPISIPEVVVEQEVHKYFNFSRAQRELAWMPRSSRAVALAQTIGWYGRYGRTLYDIDHASQMASAERRGIVEPQTRVA